MSVVRTLLTAVLPQLLFWSWNLLFGCVVFFLLPELVAELVREAWRGALPWDLATVALALLASPVLAVGAWVPIRRDGPRVFRFLFGIQGPLCVVGVVRLTLFREVTPSVVYLLGVVVAAGALLAADLYRRGPAPVSLPKLAAHAVLPLTAGWVAAVLSVYVQPTLAAFVDRVGWLWRGLVRADFLHSWTARDLAAYLTGSAFVLVTLALFALLPIAFFAIYLGTFRRLFREAAARAGAIRAASASAVGALLAFSPFVALDHHPQLAALERLATPPADDATRAALLRDEATIREGLVNAYLAKYRYWTSTGESSHVRRMYPEAWSGAAQTTYNFLTRPFVYQGESLRGDQEEAAALYAKFFDQPLQKGEQAAVLHALNATWDRSTVEAGLLDVNGEKVLLSRQELTVVQEGGVATVTLDEQYRNQTHDQQEIFYYFSLPESAAVTGLWLSDDPAWPEKYPGVLAPRGAAQQVYLEQRRERRDPALLEQVGPRQYRLRAFPILRRPPDEDQGPPLCVRLTYTALVGAGGVPTPQLTERRNVFWDARTERVGGHLASFSGGWLPSSIPVAPAAATSHAFDLGDGRVLHATPHSGPPPTGSGRRYAVVLDRSLSMRSHAAEVAESLSWLRDHVAPTNVVELYAAAGWGAGEPSHHDELPGPEVLQWFGSLDPHTLLAQYNGLRRGRSYDAVWVITDVGTYDLVAADPLPTPETGGPLWFVHLGAALAPAYDDALLQAIQGSHGGVVTTVAEAYARSGPPSEAGACTDRVDGYRWCVDGGTGEPVKPEPAFAAIATRAFVLYEARIRDMTEVANLDAVHRLARAHPVVTPYSSLVALVDEAQRKRLAELEADKDRFTREAETGVEALTAPHDVTAVPEPEEWALLAVVAAILLAARLRLRSTRAGALRDQVEG